MNCFAVVAVDPELLKLLDRVSAVDARVTGLIWTVSVVGAILAFIGFRQIQAYLKSEAVRLTKRSKFRAEYQIKRINESMEVTAQKVRNEANDKVAQLIVERSKTLEAEDKRLATYIAKAAQGAATVDQFAKDAQAAGRSMMMWESGDVKVTFTNEGYRSDTILFKNMFPTVPQVFVCDGAPDAWLITKVDEKHTDRFKWAATIVGGPVAKHSTVLQWFAIAPLTAADLYMASLEDQIKSVKDLVIQRMNEGKSVAQ